MPDVPNLDGHDDVDLLVENLSEVVFVSNARPLSDDDHRVHYAVRIQGREVPFDFRHVGDYYYGENFERDILANRVLRDGILWVPGEEAHFYALLYHGLIHKKHLASDYLQRLHGIASASANPLIAALSSADQLQLRMALDEYLRLKGYRYTRPVDRSVYFNRRNISDVSLIVSPPASSFRWSDWIYLRLRPNRFVVHLLPGVLHKNVFRIKLRLLGLFRFDICIGKLREI